MTLSSKTLKLSLRVAGWICVAATLVGCGTTEHSSPSAAASSTNAAVAALTEDRLHVGEMLTITYSDLNTPQQPFQGRIRDDGKITLLLNQEFVAAGKTVAELENEIHTNYVPRLFQQLTATVRVEDRAFYVDGQVRTPGRIVYAGPITLSGAISAAGGFDPFARQTKVKIIRANGTIEIVDCKAARKDSRLDVPIYPRDRIFVPRRIL